MIGKEQLKNSVSDSIAKFFYYDRKEDEDFTRKDAENLNDIITPEELIEMFAEEIKEAMSND